ncbi:uncharacterized protein LOC118433920 [Folsomia candida]|uniref:uncharacterized protein LOC118433920 n=1 Tax=Folsomia candida TaxID=158441 RepID=UPI001604C17E|nr:uncharacterized protein LOC118433920 [Folsomia candida]
MDTSKKFRNAVHCSKDQIRREQIHFLKRNSDFGLQLQGVSTTQCASSRRNSSSSTTESHHSVETSTTNQFRASSHNDILAPVSNNYNNTSSRGADLEYSPSAMSLLQNLFDPDDSGDENPFLRDTALELDCSELEYSPRSSDIDDDDFDSIFWEGFIHAEDFNIILKPSI